MPSDDDDDEESVDLAGRWHLPLEVLRDRSLDSRRRHDALGFYLDLILDLLSAPDNFGGAAATGKVEVSRTKAVALSSLSALCGPNGIPAASNCKSSDPSARLKIRNAIANSMDDLADAVEAVLPHKAKGGIGNSGESGGPPPPPLALPPWVNVTAHVLPVLQVLTWVRCLDLSPADSGGRGGGGGGAIGVSREGVSPREARSLLSSGLFRHLILLYAGTASSSASPHVVAGDGAAGSSNQATSVVRSQLLRTILALMSQSPSILGRYASRVPELGAALNSSSLTPRKRLGDREDRRRGGGGGRGTDGMLWAAVSARLQSSSGNGGVGSGVLRLRKRGGVKGAAGTQMAAAYPTKEEYGSMCRVSFAKLCRGVCASLLSETNGREADDATIDPPIAQFVRLANGVESLPYAGAAWVSAVTASAISGIGEEESLSASDNVALVRNAIAEIPAVSREIESKGDNAAVDLEGDHDEKKKHGPPPPRPGKDDEGRSRWSNDKEVVAARRAAKVLTLLLESPLSLKCDESFSLASKAD
uniref:Uncharacterized protein n=1 Tax=Odontella aurita TaxID=265563 RepID=A0A7S4J7C3_9STRA